MPLEDDPFSAVPSAGQRFAERRTVPRYSMTWPVEILEPINRTRFAAQTTEVSVKGCYVSTLNPLDPGTIVRLQIERRQETVDVWARVTGAPTDSGFGLAFLGTECQEVLARWISAENET